MADRSFGVREINIVGSAGTPTISSPDNINLNGNKVAISTDLQVGRNVSVAGSVSIATSAFFDTRSEAVFGDDGTLKIMQNGVDGYIDNTSGRLWIRNYDTATHIRGTTNITLHTGNWKDAAIFEADAGASLHYNDVVKFATVGYGVSVVGICSATTFFSDDINISSKILSDSFSIKDAADSTTKMFFGDEGTGHVVRLYAGGNEKLTTTSTGIYVQDNITAVGFVTATTYYGDGSNLTNLPGGGGSTAGISTTTTSFFNTLHATGTIDIGTSNAGVAVTHMTIDSADVSGTIRNRIQSGAGNTDAVLDIQTKEFLVTDPYAGKGALISADSSGTKLYKDDSVKLTTLGAGVTVTGTMYATAFSGDGSALTGVPISGSSGSFTNVDTQQLVVSGITTFQSNVYLGDTDYLFFGDDNDLQIYYDGTSSSRVVSGQELIIRCGFQTNITFQDGSSNTLAQFRSQESVDLYYNNAKTFATTGYGVTVLGTLESQGLNITGVTTTTENIHLNQDGAQLLLGASSQGDIRIYHDGSESVYYDNYGRTRYAGGKWEWTNIADNQQAAEIDQINGVKLNYSGTRRFMTTNDGVHVAGIMTATSVSIGASNAEPNLTITSDGTDTFIKELNSTGELTISTNQLKIENPSFETLARFNENADVKLYYDNAEKFNTTPQGVNVTGIATATSFNTNSTVGDGSDRGFTTKYYITSNGSSSYRFAGPGSLNTDDNPTLYFHRGFTYILENSTGSGHPFELRVSSGGAAYNPGGNFLTGSINGTQVLTVPFDAPSSIVYQCTLHSSMLGTINFVS